MATRSRKNPSNSTTQGEVTKMAEKGTLGALRMKPVSDEVLDAARGGRGHGEYDNFIDLFLAEDIRGTEVEFEGVKANSIKTGLKSAIDRAVKAGKIGESSLGVKGKDDHVYLVRSSAAASDGDE